MKILARMFDSVRNHFQPDGKLHRAYPLFEATENFFFGSASPTGAAPFVRDPLDIKRLMSMVIVALAPVVALAIYFFGWRVGAMILVSYTAGGIVEVIFAIVRKEEINEGFLVTGLLFPLILPPGLPLWMVALGVVFGVVVGKELFGGTGRNVFNPALVGRVFLALAYPAAMSGGWIEPVAEFPGRLMQYVSTTTADAISSATPLGGNAAECASLMSLLFGNVAGSAGETSALAIIAGGILLVIMRVASWRIVFGVLASFMAMETIFYLAMDRAIAPPLWQLLAGGILFGAFFMATDPVTSPATSMGKWIYAVIIGVSTALIRHLTGYVEGVMFAILLGNIAAPLIDAAVVNLRLRRIASEA